MEDEPRRRGERRKRKASGAGGNGAFTDRYKARSEAKNAQARAELTPLEPGERPGIVTVAALISTALAVSVLVAYAAGAEVDGERPPVGQIAPPVLLMSLMAVGLFRARYWAVLGFQTILALLLLFASLGLVQAETIVQAAGTTLLIAGSGYMFFKMVKAMARIQMPGDRGQDRP